MTTCRTPDAQDDVFELHSDESPSPGWYYWSADEEPVGPFSSRADATKARDEGREP